MKIVNESWSDQEAEGKSGWGWWLDERHVSMSWRDLVVGRVLGSQGEYFPQLISDSGGCGGCATA